MLDLPVDAVVHLLEVRSGETQDLFSAVTSFLSLLLMEEGKHVSKDPQRSDDVTTLTHLLDVSKAKGKCVGGGGGVEASMCSKTCIVMSSQWE